MTLRRRAAAIVSLLPLLAGPVAALDPQRTLAELGHRRWTLEQGLDGQVGALAQSRDGDLWLGAGHGLLRFDGLRFQRIACTARGGPGASTDCGTVSALLAGADGGIWAGLRAGGLLQLHDAGAGSVHHAAGSGLPDGVVYDLASDHSGRIWVATEGGVARFDGAAWQPARHWSLPAGPALALLVARDDSVWVAGRQQLYRLAADARAFVETGVAVDAPGDLAQAPDGTIWLAERRHDSVRPVADADGLVLADAAELPLRAARLLFDHDGALWMASAGDGVRRVREPARWQRGSTAAGTEDAVFETWRHADGLSADYTGVLLEDQEGTVWIGTAAGLDQFRNSAVVRAALSPGIHNLALAAGAGGQLWIGSANQPALLLDASGLRPQPMPAPVSSALADPVSGRVWLAGAQQLWSGSASSGLQPLADWPQLTGGSALVRTMARDAQGNLWVSLDRHGLFRLDTSGQWSQAPAWAAGPGQQMPVVAATDAAGQPWFGYRDNLLIHLRADGSVQRWSAESGLALGPVTAIAHAADGQVWLGGGNGLARVQDHQVMTPAIRGAPAPQTVHGLLQSADGALWVHAANGLLRIDADAVARNLADPGLPLAAERIDGIDGMAENPLQIRPLPTAVRASDGRLWFATSTGAAWVDPNHLYADHTPPSVRIDGLAADAVVLPAMEPRSRLPAGTQRVLLRFTALRLANPQSLRLRYRLLGFETGWRDAGLAREAVYTGLAPGAYTFEIAAAAADGSFGAAALRAFVVLPAFHQHWAFRLLVAVSALALLVLLYRLRMRRLAARLQLTMDARLGERERIARELHDTLLQGFHGLLLRFHAAGSRLAAEDPARQSLDRALDHAEDLLVEARERITLLRIQTPAAQQLVPALVALGEQLAQGSSTRFVAALGAAPVEPDPRVRDELCMLVREALANAFRHARARQVTLQIVADASTLAIRIRDDGIGIDPLVLADGRRAGHWGLPGMRERAARIGALLQIRASEGGGTEVLLQLPCGRPPPTS